MNDRREKILARIREILATVTGIPTARVFRNRGEFDEKKVTLPIAILLDGFERKIAEARSGRQSGPSAYIMELSPQIFVITTPKRLEKADEYGPELSALRMSLLAAMTKDAALIALLGANGGIDYRGMDTDMLTGRSMEGQLQFNFSFRYPLIPSDL
jgi:hypothetical protein